MSEEDLFLDPDSIFNRNERAPAAICGQNPILPSIRVGCGQRIETCAEVYRCADCETPFHKDCIKKHWDDKRKVMVHVYQGVKEKPYRSIPTGYEGFEI